MKTKKRYTLQQLIKHDAMMHYFNAHWFHTGVVVDRMREEMRFDALYTRLCKGGTRVVG